MTEILIETELIGVIALILDPRQQHRSNDDRQKASVQWSNLKAHLADHIFAFEFIHTQLLQLFLALT